MIAVLHRYLQIKIINGNWKGISKSKFLIKPESTKTAANILIELSRFCKPSGSESQVGKEFLAGVFAQTKLVAESDVV